jgi:hypothetical protein
MADVISFSNGLSRVPASRALNKGKYTVNSIILSTGYTELLMQAWRNSCGNSLFARLFNPPQNY